MNLDASLERLFHRNLHLIKLDLEPMRALMGLLGDPQRALIIIHVAGTNGKGSVCATLASILRVQGYKTGLYTSPHLVRFNERIQINGDMISDADLRDLIDEVEAAAAQLPGMGFRDVTFFEFTTALAFLFFHRQQAEVVVLETGMGGRLDATNIITPALSIITSIGLEHTAYLGETLGAIAGEKAGIIKPGRPVIVGPVPEEALDVIRGVAKSASAPMTLAEDQVTVTVKSVSWDGQKIHVAGAQQDYGTVMSSLAGTHQATNTAIAVAAAECLSEQVGIPITPDAIIEGIKKTRWPARGEVLSRQPPIVLDGAHNPDAAEVLAAWTKKVAGKQPVGMVIGFLADKDPAAFMRVFQGRVHRVWIVPIHSDRAMPVEDIARRLSFMPHLEIAASLENALAASRAWAMAESGVVMITGSLYLAGEVLANTTWR